MQHRSLASVAIGAAALIAVLFWQFSLAQPPVDKSPGSPANPASKAQTAQLPITQVVLFSSGVGYFQREGEVEGNARIDLYFPVGDINDLLKSMVLQDHGGGQVSAVSYDSHDPLDKALKSFALDLTKNPTQGQLLNQARGEKVEVEWQTQILKGTIVGVETHKQVISKDTVIEAEFLNVLTETGLRSLPLKEVQRVRFVNPTLEGELKRALEVLATAHDKQKRAVSLSFAGSGKRAVTVGYVIENPIWKTSYRLVLNKTGQTFLQGWAIVDNATDEDWNAVAVALVSGRPISFRMNLYEPIYVPRPLVELELFASLRPPTHGGAIDGMPAAPKLDQLRRQAEAADRAAFAGRPAAPGAAVPPAKGVLELHRGVIADVSAREVGDFFQYSIKQPVSLARQKSSMLPIVNQPVEGSKVSIYNQTVQAKHPLLGLKLKNTSGLHLMQGPITLFEGSSYAGDAKVLDLQPGEERLISYAIDQGMEVEPVAKSTPDRLVAVKIVKGILYATLKYQQTKTYNVKNRATAERVLLVEHPFRADWKLTSPPQAEERSRDVYRFRVVVPPGKSAAQEVVEEQERVSQVIVTTSDDQTIRLYLQSPVTSPKVKQALEQAVALKTKLGETLREIRRLEGEIADITKDQARLRANMERVPQNSPPFQRYMKKLDEQEVAIERLQEQVRVVRAREAEQRRGYEAFLLSLNVE